MDVSIIIPKKLVEEIARRGLDLEEIVFNSLIEKLRLDPATSTEARLELARRYLRGGAELVDKDPFKLVRNFIKLLKNVSKLSPYTLI